MYIIQHKNHLGQIKDQAIKQAIQQQIEQLEHCYQENYQATRHGWFVVLEHPDEINQPIVNLSVSLQEKLTNGEVEYQQVSSYGYEALITLNATEAVLVYLPDELFNQVVIKLPNLLNPGEFHVVAPDEY
ncbi:hypothetical protein BKE30_15065 [Alkanindiges hydrocarboniclasticus]|uniref:Uncharacterized protein n=1 Tax=Alkanindiges hydrocarboniclasticus TaxID=1907941 RepID=A0A1S8CS07_9GAMM|nr:hypothetical protein [Alkanindiges hydrocarboniclasticus]ONG37205.1 hypothetical protein BKE30_15065 [Alkanindiges hydrocarboniclasticus]